MVVSGNRIFDIIKQLTNQKDIERLINLRLSMIRNNEEKEIGLNTSTSVYDGLLDEKVKVNVTCEMIPNKDYLEVSCGSVRFDDNLIYEELIKASKEEDNVYKCVDLAVRKYLGLDTVDRKHRNYKTIREMIYHQYSESMNQDLSIRLFHNNRAGMCSEAAGVAQDMFKFLDIDSDYVIVGDLNNDFHSFNLVYPNGRDKEVILYDSSCIYEGNSLFAILDESEKEKIGSDKLNVKKERIIDTYSILFNKNIEWNKDKKYFILKDGYPQTVVDYRKPFTIERKLKFKNKYKSKEE